VSDVVPVLPAEFSTSTLVLHWEPVDYAAFYKVEIADDPQFSKNPSSGNTYNTSFTPRRIPKAVEDGAFYWRVYTFDNKNNPGPFIDLQIDIFPEKLYLPLLTK
jgi:hypothetical protein